MKNSRLSRYAAAITAAFCLMTGSLVAAGSGATLLGEPVGSVAVPAGFELREIKEVIAVCLTAREWTIKDKSKDRLVGYLNHRGNEATLTLVIDANQIFMYCEGWKVDKLGKRLKPEQPKSWIEYMKNDLVKRLGVKSATK